jgi:hypothetical protein
MLKYEDVDKEEFEKFAFVKDVIFIDGLCKIKINGLRYTIVKANENYLLAQTGQRIYISKTNTYPTYYARITLYGKHGTQRIIPLKNVLTMYDYYKSF